ncbi:MAG: hypothetical protein IKY66_05095 [Bacteroidales bacterium]|nr:hypothetical protein [Bacteroidales bacterium]
MKRLFAFVVLVFAVAASSFAQDIIVRKNGDEIVARVLEVTPEVVKYRHYHEPHGVVYSARKTEVLMVRYENGRNEVFNADPYSYLYTTDRVPAAGVVPGMKYKQIKNLYNHKDYTSTMADRYNPTWAGIASFFVPGLGQIVCDEVGRGIAWLCAYVGCGIVAGVGAGLSEYGSESGAVTCGVAAAGVLAVNVCSIIDGIRVAKKKNMYEQDLRKVFTCDVDLYPSVNYVQTMHGVQPTAGLTLAMKF